MRHTIWFNESEIIEIAKESGLKPTQEEEFLNYLESLGDWLFMVVARFQERKETEIKK